MAGLACGAWIRASLWQDGIPNPDIAGLLYEADRILAGDLPYVDTVEIKPPGAFFLVAGLFGIFLLDRGFGPWPGLVVLGLVALLAQFEATDLCARSGLRPRMLPGLLIGAVLLAAPGLGMEPMLLLVPALALYLCGEVLEGRPQEAPLRMAGTLLPLLVVAVMLGRVGVIRTEWADGWSWVVFLVVVCKAGDSAAFLVGSRIGRHGLIPSVSPKKSWEGAVAGVLAGVLAGWGCVVGAFPADGAPGAGIWVPAALSANVAGQFGDLVASLFKRAARVKDSGTLLPAFGGALDLADSFLLAAPVLESWLRFSGYHSG